MLYDADAEEYSFLIEMMPFDVEVEKSFLHEAAEQMQNPKVAISWAFSPGSTTDVLTDQDSGELNSSVGNLTWSS